MAYTTIKKPSDYFNTKLYTGNGTAQSITGVGFKPDWVWIKDRTIGNSHRLFDGVRGVHKVLYSNSNTFEETNVNSLTSFTADGFDSGSDSGMNGNTNSYVSWNWLASNTTASNTDGSITSTVSANTTSGFSIVKYTGTGANATVGHGLGVAPKMVIIKRLENATHWVVGSSVMGWDKNMYLSLDSAQQTANHFQDTAPTSSLMYLSTDAGVNGSSEDYIMYCFADVQGYSKFGSYTGNGNADGAFVYTGFKPAWVILKESSGINNWFIFDNKRNTYNPEVLFLKSNSSDAEGGSAVNNYLDFTSNGFKFRENNGAFNGSGQTYIYMAFAEEPLVGDNPATAR